MIELKTANEIDKMAVTGEFVAHVLATLAHDAEPGVNLMQLEHRARALVADRGATSCYWDYAPSFGRGPFRNVICLSVNDGVLHGLPRDYVLRDGDVLTMDFAVSIDGWAADSAMTVIVGDSPDAADSALVESTRRALAAGIAAAVPGNHIGDISAAIAEVATEAGYAVNTDFGGHGIGRTMHEDPHIPNRGLPGRGLRLRRAWHSRSSRGGHGGSRSWPLMPMVGRCAPRTVPTPRIRSTPSPSPTKVRAS